MYFCLFPLIPKWFIYSPPPEHGLHYLYTYTHNKDRNFHCGLYNPEKVIFSSPVGKVIRTNDIYVYKYERNIRSVYVYYLVRPATTRPKKLMYTYRVLCASAGAAIRHTVHTSHRQRLQYNPERLCVQRNMVFKFNFFYYACRTVYNVHFFKRKRFYDFM